MKQNTHTRHLLFFTFVIILGCETSTPDKEIFYGEYSDMKVISYDTLFHGGYHDLKNLDLDINRDGTDDIRLVSEIFGSPGLGQHPRSAIHCLHQNMSIRGRITSDTVFLHESLEATEDENNKPVIHRYLHYSYIRYAPEDSIIRIIENKFKLSVSKKGEELRQTDYFAPDSVSITSYDYYYEWSVPVEIRGDTTIYTHTSSNYTHYDFPMEEIAYIGLKMENRGREALGWLKLTIIDYYKILLMESAIQEL